MGNFNKAQGHLLNGPLPALLLPLKAGLLPRKLALSLRQLFVPGLPLGAGCLQLSQQGPKIPLPGGPRSSLDVQLVLQFGGFPLQGRRLGLQGCSPVFQSRSGSQVTFPGSASLEEKKRQLVKGG